MDAIEAIKRNLKLVNRRWLCVFKHAIIWDRFYVGEHHYGAKALHQLGTCSRCGLVKHRYVGPARIITKNNVNYYTSNIDYE
jgi:hypothetical protein